MMNTAKPPNDFAERLRRIEEKRGQTGKSPIREGRKDLRFPGKQSGTGLRNISIAAMLVLGVSLAGYATFVAAPVGAPPTTGTPVAD